jgi:hypothetical protein
VRRHYLPLFPRLPAVPGQPIADGLCEGKPANQDSAQPFLRGTGVQVVDMNQSLGVEEAFKLPNLLQEFGWAPSGEGQQPTPPGGSGAAVPAEAPPKKAGASDAGDRAPLVLLGLREHVFTQALSTSALFMSYSEEASGPGSRWTCLLGALPSPQGPYFTASVCL